MSKAPEFDELLRVVEGLGERVSCDSMQLILVSRATGLAQFISANENPNLREEMTRAIQSAAIPLGMIGWRREGNWLVATKFIFPWVKEDDAAVEVFDKICDEAAQRVGEELERHQRVN